VPTTSTDFVVHNTAISFIALLQDSRAEAAFSAGWFQIKLRVRRFAISLLSQGNNSYTLTELQL